MANRYTVASGAWVADAATVWDNGIGPVNNDQVTITAGHTVTHDADQSGFAAGITLVINGTLQWSTSAGAYYLKCNGHITGTGSFLVGTAVTPLPLTVTGAIYFNGAFYFNSANLAIAIYPSHPTHRYVQCTGAEAAGQTVLEVDTDITADGAWIDGARVQISDVNGWDSETRIIAAGGRAPGSITITAGLTNAKIAGALIILLTRNFTITGTTNDTPFLQWKAGSYIGAEIQASKPVSAIYGLTNSLTFAGVLSSYLSSDFSSRLVFSGVLVGDGSGRLSGPNLLVSGALISASQYGATITVGGEVEDTIFAGCSAFAMSTSIRMVNCCVFGCSYGLGNSSGARIINSVFGKTPAGQTLANGTDLYRAQVSGKNVILASTTQVGAPPYQGEVVIENFGYIVKTGLFTAFPNGSIDSPGKRRGWCYGGSWLWNNSTLVITPTSVVSSICPAFINRSGFPPGLSAPLPVQNGQSVTLTVHATASGTVLDCSLVLDPNDLLSCLQTQTKDAELTDTTFSVNDTVVAGDNDWLDWEFRVNEYVGAATVTVTSVTATIAGAAWTLDFARWEWISSQAAEADVKNTTVYGRYNELTGTYAGGGGGSQLGPFEPGAFR